MSLTSSDATGDRIVKTLNRVVYDGTNLRGWVQCISEAMQRLDIPHMLVSEASRTAVATHDTLKDLAANEAIDLTQLPDSTYEAAASVHSQGGDTVKHEQKLNIYEFPSLADTPQQASAVRWYSTVSGTETVLYKHGSARLNKA